MSSTTGRLRLLAAFAVLYFVWGSAYLAIRFAIETLPPLLMSGARFFTAGVLLLTALRIAGVDWPERRTWKPAAVIGLLLLFAGNGSVAWAEQFVDSGVAALLVANMPIFVVLLQWTVQRLTPSAADVIGIVLGLTGVIVLVGPEELVGAGSVDPAGVAAIMIGSLCWAAGSLYARTADLPRSTMLATAMQMTCGGLALIVGGLALGEWAKLDISAASTVSLLAFAYLVLIVSIAGYTAYNFVIVTTTPAKASTFVYVNPAVAVVLGWLLAGEPMTPRVLVAIAIIVPAVALIVRGPGKGISGNSASGE